MCIGIVVLFSFACCTRSVLHHFVTQLSSRWTQLDGVGGSLRVLSTPKFSLPVSYNVGNSKTADFINSFLSTGKIDKISNAFIKLCSYLLKRTACTVRSGFHFKTFSLESRPTTVVKFFCQ